MRENDIIKKRFDTQKAHISSKYRREIPHQPSQQQYNRTKRYQHFANPTSPSSRATSHPFTNSHPPGDQSKSNLRAPSLSPSVRPLPKRRKEKEAKDQHQTSPAAQPARTSDSTSQPNSVNKRIQPSLKMNKASCLAACSSSPSKSLTILLASSRLASLASLTASGTQSAPTRCDSPCS